MHSKRVIFPNRKDVAKIGWKSEVDLEVEGGEERCKKTGEDIFSMFDVGQSLRVDAVKKANQGRTYSVVK